MIPKVTRGLILSLVSLQVFSQDVQINLDKIQFSSEFEKKSFEAYVQNKPDYMALLLAPDESVTDEAYVRWKNQFEKSLKALTPELSEKKKNDRKVKFLYEKIHKQYLTKYENINFFSQVFKDGVYNCVSATGLYSLVFDYYSIPYSIQERPTHVYLVAYPKGEQVQIETTIPIGGYFKFDQTFKQNYVKKLSDYKLISALEYQTKSVDELFDTYFFNVNSEGIDLQKLVGIQYLNSGLYLLDKNENEKAFHQFEKAYLFYPSERIRYIMFTIGLDVFNRQSYSDEKKAIYLSKLAQFRKEGINEDMIKGEFFRITHAIYQQNGDKERYDNIYKNLINSLSEENIKNQISYIYNFEVGRSLYNQGRYTDANPYFEDALQAKPNNVDMTNLFMSNLTQTKGSFEDIGNYISKLQQYREKYPSLVENNHFTSMLFETMLEAVSHFFEKGDVKQGEKYRALFEGEVEKKSNNNLNSIDFQIGRAYSAACVYYFKTGQKTKAKLLVDKGLSFAPKNYELRMRKEMLSK